MKINITKETFLEGIQIIQTGITSRVTLPILHNFLIETENGRIKLMRTDMEMASVHYLNAEVAQEGAITVPLKEFSEILKNLPADKEINISVDPDNKVHIKSGRVKFWVMGAPKSEYPLIPEVDAKNTMVLKAAQIQSMVESTIFSASSQETRYVLNGMLWVGSGGKIEVVATDGRRLALASSDAPVNKDFKMIIPTKVLNELLRLFSIIKVDDKTEINLNMSSNQVVFSIGETTYISRLIEGNFPNYEQVIPSKKNISFDVFTKELTATTKRAALCVSDLGGTVKYTLGDDSLKVTAYSQKMDFMEEIKIDYKAEAFDISFNPQYLLDVLKNIKTEKTVFSFLNPVQPVLIEPENKDNFKYVVMPVRS